jgi:hypothetical protein
MFFKDAVMQRDKGKTRMQQLLDQAERNMKMPR